MVEYTTLGVSEIVVGHRHRQDVGDLGPLCESLSRVGMLQPIGVRRSDRSLVFGMRRLMAARQLGWERVPVLLLDKLEEARSALIAERDENTCRKEMTVSELASLGRALEDLERPLSQQRQEASRFGSQTGPAGPRGSTREVVAEALGVSPSHYQRVKKIAEKGTPELVQAADEGVVSVREAERLSHLPDEEQRQEVARRRAGAVVITADDEQAGRRRRSAPCDAVGQEVPVGLRDTFFDPELSKTIESLESSLRSLSSCYDSIVRSLSHKPYVFCQFGECIDKLSRVVSPSSGLLVQAIDHLRVGVPYAVCSCGCGSPRSVCRGSGYLPRWRYEELTGQSGAATDASDVAG